MTKSHMQSGTVNTDSDWPMSPLDVLTLEEAAVYLQVSVEAARAEAEAGRLVGRQIGTEWRFLRESIVTWLQTPSPSVVRLVDLPTTDETPEEQEAFLEHLRALRKSWGPARRPKVKADG